MRGGGEEGQEKGGRPIHDGEAMHGDGGGGEVPIA